MILVIAILRASRHIWCRYSRQKTPSLKSPSSTGSELRRSWKCYMREKKHSRRNLKKTLTFTDNCQNFEKHIEITKCMGNRKYTSRARTWHVRFSSTSSAHQNRNLSCTHSPCSLFQNTCHQNTSPTATEQHPKQHPKIQQRKQATPLQRQNCSQGGNRDPKQHPKQHQDPTVSPSTFLTATKRSPKTTPTRPNCGTNPSLPKSTPKNPTVAPITPLTTTKRTPQTAPKDPFVAPITCLQQPKKPKQHHKQLRRHFTSLTATKREANDPIVAPITSLTTTKREPNPNVAPNTARVRSKTALIVTLILVKKLMKRVGAKVRLALLQFWKETVSKLHRNPSGILNVEMIWTGESECVCASFWIICVSHFMFFTPACLFASLVARGLQHCTGHKGHRPMHGLNALDGINDWQIVAISVNFHCKFGYGGKQTLHNKLNLQMNVGKTNKTSMHCVYSFLVPTPGFSHTPSIRRTTTHIFPSFSPSLSLSLSSKCNSLLNVVLWSTHCSGAHFCSLDKRQEAQALVAPKRSGHI